MERIAHHCATLITSLSLRIDPARRNDNLLHLLVHRVLNGGLEAQDGVRLDALVEASDALLAEDVSQEDEGAAVLVVCLDGGGDAFDGEGYGEVGPFGEAAEDEVGEGADVGAAGDVDVTVFYCLFLVFCCCVFCLYVLCCDRSEIMRCE